MSLDFDNMNDLFREGLDDFKVDPNPKVWDNLEQQLGKKQITKINSETFNGFKVEPGVNLWNRIAKQLWIHNFYRFTANQFNIYYLTAALVVIAGVSIFLTTQLNNQATPDLVAEHTSELSIPVNDQTDQNPVVNEDKFAENNTHISEPNDNYISESGSSELPENSINSITADEDNPIEYFSENNDNISTGSHTPVIIDDAQKQDDNSVTGNLNLDSKADNKKTIDNSNKILAAGDNKSVNEQFENVSNINLIENTIAVPFLPEFENGYNVNSLSETEITTVETFDYNLAAFANEGNTQIIDNSIDNKDLTNSGNIISPGDITDQSAGNIPASSSNMEVIFSDDDSKNVEEENSELTETISEESGLELLSTIKLSNLAIEQSTDDPKLTVREGLPVDYPDTVGTDADGKPIVLETNHWSCNVYFTPGMTWSSLSPSTNEDTDYVNTRKDAEETGLNLLGLAGVDLSFSHKKFLVRTGINYAGYGEKYNYRANKTITTSSYNYFESGYFNIDTIMITHIDSMIEGSSYEVPYVQRTWVETIDSMEVIGTDTLDLGNISSQNKYHYIEIPLAIGYEGHSRKFSYSGTIGFVAGYLFTSTGKTLSENNNKNVNLTNELPFNKFRFAVTGSLGITYHISSRVGVFGEFYYRQSLNSVYKSNYSSSQKHKFAGLKLGIRINLDRAEKFDKFVDTL